MLLLLPSFSLNLPHYQIPTLFWQKMPKFMGRDLCGLTSVNAEYSYSYIYLFIWLSYVPARGTCLVRRSPRHGGCFGLDRNININIKPVPTPCESNFLREWRQHVSARPTKTKNKSEINVRHLISVRPNKRQMWGILFPVPLMFQYREHFIEFERQSWAYFRPSRIRY